MQITRIERIVVDAGHTPTAGRHMRRGLADWALSEVCKVTTDTGLVGWGETLPHYTWGVVTDAERRPRPGFANPADLLWDDSLGAGLQQALFDVVGKALGVPVHRLLGSAVRARCPLAWWCYDMPPEDWASEARAGIEAGYTAFKLKARPWFDIVEQVEAVSAATPAHAKLDLDFNGAAGRRRARQTAAHDAGGLSQGRDLRNADSRRRTSVVTAPCGRPCRDRLRCTSIRRRS